MDRREALKRTAVLMGGIVFMPSILSSLKGCSPSPDYTMLAFKTEQANLVEVMAETLIPRTDTPGARDAGVISYIDGWVGRVYNAEQRESFLRELDAFSAGVKQQTGKDFTELNEVQKKEIMLEATRKALEEQHNQPYPPFMIAFRELTIRGYCVSEAGATQHLRYMQNFGPYRGCIPFEEVGRTWAM
ncbi:MAG: gluconate 2-dehydrogenase subunit 3 family protein [Balneolales bacterium]|nr:gluconate 2-dehydrogenase subunit 3 family protein [Balneolales bacterium]